MTTATMPSSRNVRQKDLLPQEVLDTCHAVVVGVGAIGRQVALQLAAMGIPSATLIDFDRVEKVNLGPQGFFDKDVGEEKTSVTRLLMQDLNPEIGGVDYCDRFRRADLRTYFVNPPRKNVVFCCVDSMEIRKLVWETVRASAVFFVDGRMNGEVIRVLTAFNPVVDKLYEKSLFSDGEAFQGSCTARSTIYSANIAAGMMLAQFAKWTRCISLNPDFMLNLLSMELSDSNT